MKSAGKARNNGLYRHIRTSKEIIRNLLNDYSKYLRCDELVYADIFELRLSEEQMELIRMSVKSHPDILCLASAEELKSECYGGIEKNIGNNGVWLLGE